MSNSYIIGGGAGGADPGHLLIPFGSSIASTDAWVGFGGDSQKATTTITPDEGYAWHANYDCTLRRITGNTQAGDETSVFQLDVNGTTEVIFDISATNPWTRNMTVAVSAEDDVTIKFILGTPPNPSIFELLAEYDDGTDGTNKPFLWFGADVGTGGILKDHGYDDSANLSGQDYHHSAASPFPDGSSISGAELDSDGTAGTDLYQILVDGVVEASVSLSATGEGADYTLAISLDQAQQVRTRAAAGDALGDSVGHVEVSPNAGDIPVGPEDVSVLEFGGNVTANDFYQPDVEPDSTAPTSSGLDTRHYIGKSGMVDRITWDTASADSSTQLNVKRNGTTEETVTLTGSSGLLLLASPFAAAADDEVEVEHAGGTAPGNGHVNLGINHGPAPARAFSLSFGGLVTGISTFAESSSSVDTAAASSGALTRNRIPYLGYCNTLGFVTDTGDGTTVIDINQSGATEEAHTLSGNTGADDLATPFIATAGEEIECDYDSGQVPAGTSLVLLFEDS